MTASCDRNWNVERKNNNQINPGHPTDFVVNASDYTGHVKCGLYVAFDGPEKPHIEFDHLKDGNIRVTYLPSVAGEWVFAQFCFNENWKNVFFGLRSQFLTFVRNPLNLKRSLNKYLVK